jgi:hypothetical protein
MQFNWSGIMVVMYVSLNRLVVVVEVVEERKFLMYFNVAMDV